jgi:hypothetical protein
MSNTISSDLSAGLQQLSELANNDTLSAEDKKSALEKAGAKTLAEINAEMSSLNFTSSKFAENIARLLTDGKYNLLPSPAKMSTDLQTLRQVADALVENLNSMSIDITTIMRFLTEAQRSLSNTKSVSQIQNRKLKLEAAKNEFEAKKRANEEQLTADLLSAASEVVMGAVQLGGSVVSIIGATKNIGKSKTVLKDSHSLSNLSQDKKIAHQNLADSAKNFEEFKPSALKRIKELEQIEISGFATADEKIDLKNLRNNLSTFESKFKYAQSEFSLAEKNENILSKIIDTDNLNIKASTQKFEAVQQITSSSAIIMKGLTQSIAAYYSFKASTDRLQADMQGLGKDMASQSEQSAQEASRNMMEAARNTIQSLSAAQQSIDASFGSMNNKA